MYIPNRHAFMFYTILVNNRPHHIALVVGAMGTFAPKKQLNQYTAEHRSFAEHRASRIARRLFGPDHARAMIYTVTRTLACTDAVIYVLSVCLRTYAHIGNCAHML